MFVMRSLMTPVCGWCAALALVGALGAQEGEQAPAKEPAAAQGAKASTPEASPREGAAESLARTVKIHADECSQANLRGDFEAALPFVPKKLLDLTGGREEMKKRMEQGQAELKRRGVTIDSATTAMPAEPENHGGVLVTMVPTTAHLTTPQGKVVASSHMIAISEDGGRRWFFADSATVNEEKLATLYPILKGKVKIPVATARRVSDK